MAGRAGADGDPSLEAQEVCVRPTVDLADVAGVMEELLRRSDRPILLEGRRVAIDCAAAADGLLPVFLVAGEALWREAMGEGLGLEIERDEGALLGYRVVGVGAKSFPAVMLAMMEAISQIARPEGIIVTELNEVWKEATARIDAMARVREAAQ